MDESKLNSPRDKIDSIDREILRLLNQRAEIALDVGAAKTNVDTSLCDPTRERDVLNNLKKENAGPFTDENIVNIFQRVIDESLLLQQRTFRHTAEIIDTTKNAGIGDKSRVAFLGERGSFSEEAALGILGEDCSSVAFPTFEDLFNAIRKDKADFILTPLENSLVGSVHRCYDLLLESSLSITAEIVLPVSHYLIACEEATIETLRTVESHPVALAQCEKFFASHPDLTGIAADDTAGSIRRAVESGDVTRAGIGGKRCAALYGGKILRSHIEDHRENFTRFALLANSSTENASGNKISLVVRLAHKPGALHNALRPFVRRGIDLLKIESRPIKGEPGHFNFYLDLSAPPSESELRGALDDIRDEADEVRVLGRYSRIGAFETQKN